MAAANPTASTADILSPEGDIIVPARLVRDVFDGVCASLSNEGDALGKCYDAESEDREKTIKALERLIALYRALRRGTDGPTDVVVPLGDAGLLAVAAGYQEEWYRDDIHNESRAYPPAELASRARLIDELSEFAQALPGQS